MANKIYVYRPHDLPQDAAGIAYDEDGKEIAGHISSDFHFWCNDMGLTDPITGIGRSKHEKYKERYPDGYELEAVVGNWRDHPVMGKWIE